MKNPTTGRAFPEFASYALAEREAYQTMGDTGQAMAVVEDLLDGGFLLMPLDDAETYVLLAGDDLEIQYRAVPVS